MKQLSVDVAVIGGGPAGLAAALSAKAEGAQKVMIIERNPALSAFCSIHHGFGRTGSLN